MAKAFPKQTARGDRSQSSLGQILARHTAEYFNRNPRLSAFSADNKAKIIAGFYRQIFNFAKAENPLLAMRKSLAAYAIAYARYQVLCLTEEEKAAAFYADSPYISGELHKHIGAYADRDDEFGELQHEHAEISDAELVSYCNTLGVLHLYFLNGINYAREQCGDVPQGNDWLLPFVESMLIWAEAQARRKIGLPELLPDISDALRHSAFTSFVVSGCQNPLLEWEKAWGKCSLS